MDEVKKVSYAVICDKQFEDGLKDVDNVVELKTLGGKTTSLLYKRISCIMGVASRIEETYGLSYDEIIEVLQKKYNYKIISKHDMVEPYKYGVFDTYYAWEFYAQNKEYAEECDNLVIDGVDELLRVIMSRSVEKGEN